MANLASYLGRVPEAHRAAVLRTSINLFPPYRAAGIRARSIDAKFRWVEMELRERPWNRNYFGTHFGGSLYSMCDPWFCLIVFEGLGRDYVVWDERATIQFASPGRGTVQARFEVAPSRIEEIRAQAESGEAVHPEFRAPIRDAKGRLVAVVDKRVYVRKKNKGRR